MKVLFKSILTKIAIVGIILVNTLSGVVFLWPLKPASAASYSDISNIPPVSASLPDGSSNPVHFYDFSFTNNGDSLLVKGSGPTAGKQVSFQYVTGKATDASGREISFKYYRPPLTPSGAGYTEYKDLFFNRNNIGYIESDNTLRTPNTCQRDPDTRGHIRIVGFLPNPSTGITIERIMQAYQGENKPDFEELISSGAIISVPKSPYNVLVCSYTRDGKGDFNGQNEFMGIGAYRIQVSGAGSGNTGGGGNGETWYDYRGRALGKSDVNNRFKFVNPRLIVDTGLTLGNGEYVVYHMSTERDEPFPDNDEFWFDGVAMYKPAKWKNGEITNLDKSDTGNKCMGMFLVDARGKNDGEVYGDIYGIPAGDVNGRCYINKNQTPAAQYWGFYKDQDPEDIIGADNGNLIDTYEITNNFKAIDGRQRALWFARLFWNNPDDIRTYGTNVQLKRQPQVEEDRVLNAMGSAKPSLSRDPQIWTTDQCKDDNAIDYPFVLVDYSNQYTGLRDNAVDSPNALARIYIPNDDTLASDWVHRYDGDETECLFGGKVKYNWIGENNNDSNTYIANLSKSVGNGEDSFDREDAPEPGGDDEGNVDGQGDDDPTCLPSTLSWIFCPIINIISEGADKAFNNFIVPLLVSKPLDVSRNSSQYKAWNNFRNIANVLLIIFLLLAIYGMAKGD